MPLIAGITGESYNIRYGPRWLNRVMCGPVSYRQADFLRAAFFVAPPPAFSAAQRRRAASAMRARPSGLSRRLRGLRPRRAPVVSSACGVAAAALPRRAVRALSIADRCCSSCRIIWLSSFTMSVSSFLRRQSYSPWVLTACLS
jgi:hypothetical protein